MDKMVSKVNAKLRQAHSAHRSHKSSLKQVAQRRKHMAKYLQHVGHRRMIPCV